MQKTGRIIAGLFACALALWAVQASAATESISRSFNHMTTGFPLSGGHATAACETCHVGGVFKGTPRACDGCHAMGKRVIATPKPNSHIVTDAPCESCHFFAHTWLGARYNHGSAAPGQCRNCHAGRLATGKPNSHNVGKKATESCDSCHRSFAWTPASWNHNGMVGSCDQAGCHVAGANTWYKGVSTPHARTGMATFACETCHNFYAWHPAPYNHAGAVGRCDSCHNGTVAITTPAGHVSIGTSDCSECHINTTRSWTPALGGKPANHIPYNSGVTCNACHTAATGRVSVSVLHAFSVATSTCQTCHISPNPYQGNNQQTKSSHEGSSGNNCTQSGCHTKGAASYLNWDE